MLQGGSFLSEESSHVSIVIGSASISIRTILQGLHLTAIGGIIIRQWGVLLLVAETTHRQPENEKNNKDNEVDEQAHVQVSEGVGKTSQRRIAAETVHRKDNRQARFAIVRIATVHRVDVVFQALFVFLKRGTERLQQKDNVKLAY